MPPHIVREGGGRRVVVVDHHAIFRTALRNLLDENGFDVVGEAQDGDQGVDLAHELRPDVVAMAVILPGISGIEATRRLVALTPESRVVMLTASDDIAHVDEAILAGAVGYLLKDDPADRIAAAMRAAAEGESVFSPKIASQLVWRASNGQSEPDQPRLTHRELEVLELMAEGRENSEIASELSISVETVKNHVSSVLAKLEAVNRTEAAVQAVRRGLL
jgi:DNA-binding NarL/FixJ family response regulator